MRTVNFPNGSARDGENAICILPQPQSAPNCLSVGSDPPIARYIAEARGIPAAQHDVIDSKRGLQINHLSIRMVLNVFESRQNVFHGEIVLSLDLVERHTAGDASCYNSDRYARSSDHRAPFQAKTADMSP